MVARISVQKERESGEMRPRVGSDLCTLSSPDSARAVAELSVRRRVLDLDAESVTVRPDA